jgi:hypothetical protein
LFGFIVSGSGSLGCTFLLFRSLPIIEDNMVEATRNYKPYTIYPPSGETTNMPAMQGLENEQAILLLYEKPVSKPDSFCTVTNSFVDLKNCNLLKTIIVKYWHRIRQTSIVKRESSFVRTQSKSGL